MVFYDTMLTIYIIVILNSQVKLQEMPKTLSVWFVNTEADGIEQEVVIRSSRFR